MGFLKPLHSREIVLFIVKKINLYNDVNQRLKIRLKNFKLQIKILAN